MIIPKFIIDQSIINNEKLLLNNILTQQRQLKQTLALFLEKISDGIYNATDIQDSTSLISCLDSIKKSFGNIKDNINQILELKKYLDDSSLTSYDSSYFENYNKKYMELFEKISEDNVFYYSFMESLLKYMEVHFPKKSNNAVKTTNNTKEKEFKLEEAKVFNIDDYRIPTENRKKIVNTVNSTSFSDNISTSVNSSTDFKFSNYLDNINIDNNNNLNYLNSFNNSNYSSNIINTTSETSSNNVNTQIKNEPINIASNKNTNTGTPNDKILERTLYVSSSHKNAILPYSTVELENCFSSNPEKYSSIQDIIDKEYTVSLKNFQNSAISRFKETYNLARNKSGFSVLKSLSLANELLFASNVDPIIIRACKNVNELYIYLSCLEDNILNEFKCFKIIYDT